MKIVIHNHDDECFATKLSKIRFFLKETQREEFMYSSDNSRELLIIAADRASDNSS